MAGRSHCSRRMYERPYDGHSGSLSTPHRPRCVSGRENHIDRTARRRCGAGGSGTARPDGRSNPRRSGDLGRSRHQRNFGAGSSRRTLRLLRGVGRRPGRFRPTGGAGPAQRSRSSGVAACHPGRWGNQIGRPMTRSHCRILAFSTCIPKSPRFREPVNRIRPAIVRVWGARRLIRGLPREGRHRGDA